MDRSQRPAPPREGAFRLPAAHFPRRPKLASLLVPLLAPLCGALLIASCAHSDKAGGTMPGDLAIRFGEGGGFTGRWEGHAIEADGRLWRWEGLGDEEVRTPRGCLEREQLRALWSEIERLGFFDLPPGEPGDLTRFIRVAALGRERQVSWIPEAGPERLGPERLGPEQPKPEQPGPEQPGPAQQLYRKLHAIVQDLEGE